MPRTSSPRYGVARALSKLGHCSRSQAARLVQAGQVRVNGVTRRDPEFPTDPARDRLEVDGQAVSAAQKRYLALNKPRGLVTTAADEKGRPTVYTCLGDSGAFVSPVGRLDQASEGLLLFTNDTAWAARITAPGSPWHKVYHVQVKPLPTEALVQRLRAGVEEGGELLKVRTAILLRAGEKNGWLEVQLDEGRNRHIRRMLSALGVEVLRLVRVAIGPLELGSLAKGQWRPLTSVEVAQFRPGGLTTPAA